MSSSSSLGTGTPRSSLSSVSSFGIPGVSKFEKDVHAALNRGLSDCKNMRHWHVVQVPNRTGGTKVWTDVEIKPHRQILQLMAPGKAKCSCEREACQWAWVPGNWNHKGMFQTQWVLSGTEEKGIPMDDKRDRGRPARKVFPVYHSLTDRKLNKLSERFPEWLFIGMYGTSHDHPLAHYSTKVASERLMSMLPAGTVECPKIYIDLNGNPQSNKLFMARNPGIEIVTLVECITPKDFIRKATKWGAKFDADGTQNYWDDTHVRDIPRDMAGMGESISGFISIHTTYYYDAQEIAALLNWAPNAVLYAAAHRFDGMFGSLNDGEQEWEKIPTSFGYRVNQKNVATGEAYEHPDNAWMYDCDSRICGSNAFGWTMNQLCDETFLFMMVACPVTQARMSSKVFMEDTNRPVTLRAGDKPQTKDEMAANRRIDVSLCGVKTSVPIKPRLVPFFDEMRKTAIDKGRGPKEYKDHVSRCKVAAKGLLADKGVELDSQELEDIIRFSFIIDFEQQFSNVSHLFGTSFTKVVQADYMYKHGSSMVTSGTMALLMDIAMSAVESKTIQKAGVKALQHTVAHASRRGVLNTIN